MSDRINYYNCNATGGMVNSLCNKASRIFTTGDARISTIFTAQRKIGTDKNYACGNKDIVYFCLQSNLYRPCFKMLVKRKSQSSFICFTRSETASVACANEEYGWMKSTGEDEDEESAGIDKIPCGQQRIRKFSSGSLLT